MRLDQCKTGPFEVSLIKIAINKIKRKKEKNKIKTKNTSKDLFILIKMHRDKNFTPSYLMPIHKSNYNLIKYL